MTNTYTFHLSKTVSYTPRYKEKTKRIEIKARDLQEARSFVELLYTGWDVRMFWLNWNK